MMKIAQVSPLYESVPPQLYGGTERVVSYLTEELVRQGHEVTLFASGDSVTQARLVSPCERSLRLDPNCMDQLAHHILMLEQLYQRAADFDIVHFHIDYLHFPLSRRYGIPNVTTLHGRLDLPDLAPLYREYRDMRVVSISDDQRQPLSWANWQGTVYHGLPLDLYPYHPRRGDYLAFLGRISPEKRVDRAIEVAKRVGMPLRIAAKIDRKDEEYFRTEIEPLLNHPLIEYIGEVADADKAEFLGNAYALLFLIDWPEPFGLVMAEAMACGTPVIATLHGSVGEVMEDGRAGFVIEDRGDDLEAVVRAIQRIDTIDRKQCRQVFEERFSAPRMASDYVAIYQRILDEDAASQANRMLAPEAGVPVAPNAQNPFVLPGQDPSAEIMPV